MSTANCVTTGVAKEDHHYEWRIQNFEMVQKNERLVTDQMFEINTGSTSACHSLWMIGLKICNGGSHIGFYCKLMGVPGIEEIEIPMGFAISVRYRDGNTINKSLLNTLKIGGSCSFENVWTFNWPDWGRYTSSADGSLTVNVTLTIFAPVKPSKNVDISLETFAAKSLTKLQENLTTLLGNCEDTSGDSDDKGVLAGEVKIVSSDEKVISCHKLILSARSPYFATMFSSGFMESSTGIIKMDDLSSKTIKVILHYIYTGKLLDLWLEPDVIVEFTYAAGKYQFSEILELLDILLGSTLEQTSATSVVLLELANKLCLKKAEAELMKRIVKFTVSAETSDDFFKLIRDPAETRRPN